MSTYRCAKCGHECERWMPACLKCGTEGTTENQPRTEEHEHAPEESGGGGEPCDS